MHVLFVHQTFPAQFGHIAKYLVEQHDFRCTFVSEKRDGMVAGIERIQYQCRSGATQNTHICSRTFENQIWHSQAVVDALQARPDVRPDLIVGHSGFASTLFLRELYDCPIVNYFEYFYRTGSANHISASLKPTLGLLLSQRPVNATLDQPVLVLGPRCVVLRTTGECRDARIDAGLQGLQDGP